MGQKLRRLLFAWIGNTDLRAPAEESEVGLGPIAQALESDLDFARVVLLHDYPVARVRPYVDWLNGRLAGRVAAELVHRKLTSPVDLGEIYRAAVETVTEKTQESNGLRLTFHLSPGTPAMAAVWIILSKTRFLADVIQSSKTGGVQVSDVPFDLSAEYLPDIIRGADQRLEDLSVGQVPERASFGAIVYRGASMKRVIQRAEKVAVRTVPVLIEGESGTGKELLARAIHDASARRTGPFVAVNCGAIPESLVESELFGHKKGAFTGATAERVGHFESASKGTLFLDEVGELPLATQVKLLRVLQEGKVVRVGETRERSMDVRLIAATNRSLADEVGQGQFREDLFHRLAVAVIRLPPLRERKGDLSVLIDHLLAAVNAEAEREETALGYRPKKLSSGARNVLLNHEWPGNVRELLNTLRRAAVWVEGETLSAADISDALLRSHDKASGSILGRQLEAGFSLPDLLAEVARHYLSRAMEEAGKNKTKAASLVGLPSYQTLTNWLRRYGLED